MRKRKAAPDEYDPDDLKAYMALPAKKKLRFLEKMNAFLSKAMPPASKKAWEELQKRGW